MSGTDPENDPTIGVRTEVPDSLDLSDAAVAEQVALLDGKFSEDGSDWNVNISDLVHSLMASSFASMFRGNVDPAFRDEFEQDTRETARRLNDINIAAHAQGRWSFPQKAAALKEIFAFHQRDRVYQGLFAAGVSAAWGNLDAAFEVINNENKENR